MQHTESLLTEHGIPATYDPDQRRWLVDRNDMARLAPEIQSQLEGVRLTGEAGKSAQGGSIGDRLSRLSDDAWVNLALGVGTIGFQAVSMMMQMKMRDDFLKMQLSENRRGREHEMDMLMARLGSQERVASTTGGGGGVHR
jgi:hypothetical protein